MEESQKKLLEEEIGRESYSQTPSEDLSDYSTHSYTSTQPLKRQVSVGLTEPVKEEEYEKKDVDLVEEIPEDVWGLCWLVLLMLGIGVLFPFNAFLTAIDYFSDLYPDFAFRFAVTTVYMWPSVLSLFLSIKFAARFSLSLRITVFYTINALIFIVFIFTTKIPGLSTNVSLIITLVCISITGFSSGLLFGTTLGLAALFPPSYTTAVMSGNGVAGVLVGLIRIITKLALPNDTYLSIVVYFSITSLILIACIASYFSLFKLKAAMYYMNKKLNQEEQKTLMKLKTKRWWEAYLKILKKVKLEATEVFFVFFITLSLFPGMTLQMQSTGGLSSDWFGVLTTFTFQVFDFIGRTTPRLVLIPRSMVWLPVAARVVFFPLFILSINPVVFNSNIWYFGFMAAFAISNGYLCTLSMMYGPTRVKEREKEETGIIMSFFLNLGILSAVHFAYLLLYLVKNQAPF